MPYNPKMVVMEWMKGKKGDASVSLLVKVYVLTLADIPLNPRGLKDMKYDMGGPAVVVGTMIHCKT